jgi:hypothetical protein
MSESIQIRTLFVAIMQDLNLFSCVVVQGYKRLISDAAGPTLLWGGRPAFSALKVLSGSSLFDRF